MSAAMFTVKRLQLVALLSIVAISSSSWASTSAEGSNSGTSIEARARGSIEAGRPREAIDLLRGNVDTQERGLLLARAYLDDGNDFWAIRTLQGLVQADEDCGSSLWLAFALIRQGSIDEATEILGDAVCSAGSPLEARRFLLETLIATTSGEVEEARRTLRSAISKERVFPEDRKALLALRPSVEERYVSPISGRVELHSGATSNARAGSPVDLAATEGPPSSALAHLAASTRAVLPTERATRPLLEAEVRGLGIGSTEARELSYLHLSARPALQFVFGPTLLAGYRIDALGILGGDQFDDGPIWFHQGHRAEFEAEVIPMVTAFGGAGYRNFRESRRSRFEVDLGLGGAWRPAPSISLLGAVTGRSHSANRDFYDLLGVTAIAHAQWQLPRGLTGRLGLVGSLDDYPRSEGYFATGVARRDLLAKLTAGLWLPHNRSGLRFGLTYEFSNRFSTAPDYKYVDHRLLMRGQWAFSLDPRGPRTDRPAGHVPLAWGLEGEDGTLEESIQDLLRQDETVRAGSSCVE